MISRASCFEHLNILDKEVVKILGDVGADGKKMEGFGARWAGGRAGGDILEV